MRWKLEVARSNKMARRVRTTEGMAASRLKWSEDAHSTFPNLDALTKLFGFRWDTVEEAGRAKSTSEQPQVVMVTVAKFPAEAPQVLVDLLGLDSANEKSSCVKVLGSCLTDIAQYAERLDAKAGSGYRPLGEDGRLEVYFLRPTKRAANGTETGFRRLFFALSVRSKKDKVYVWSVRGVEGLSIGKTVDQWNISEVTQVDAKVWIMTGQEGGHAGSAAIKIEATSARPRHDATIYLADKYFESAPNRAKISENEITFISGNIIACRIKEGLIKDTQAYVDDFTHQLVETSANGSLKEMIVFDGIIPLKIAFYKAGDNLKQRIDKANTKNALRLLHLEIFGQDNARIFKIFGHIATFDLITGNNDRFRSIAVLENSKGIGLNLKNFDYNTANCVIAVDNFNPNPDPPVQINVWHDAPIFENAYIGRKYAELVLADLIKKTNAEDFFAKAAELGDPDRRRELQEAFNEGMRRGAKQLKSILPQFEKAARDRNWGEPGNEMIRRIKLLKGNM